MMTDREMRRLILLVVAVLMLTGTARASSWWDNYAPDNKKVRLTSTNLPIVWITVDGQYIDSNERITARMKILHNGNGQLNYADTVAHPGQKIDYEGYVALRYRGSSSFSMSDKKPYSFRPLTAPLEAGGEKKKVNILGMGKDNNWALLAPYADKSMMRDLLTFELARQWMEYTPQGRYCELFLDGIYYGVYILSEVVSKGKHRIDLPDPGESGDDLTGGYIMEVDRAEGVTHVSKYHPVSSRGTPYTNRYIYFQYKSPDYDELNSEQVKYIKNRIDQMESALWNYRPSGETTYEKYIDVTNFIDYQLAEEFCHNVDAYRLSGKFFKRRDSEDPRFKMVVWDMNLAYGNANYNEAWRTDTWMYKNNDIMYSAYETYLIPFWWYKLNSNPSYISALKKRWAQYRRSNLRQERVLAVVDSLANVITSHGAEQRNSQAWPRWGVWVWPNYYVASNYADEVAWLKQWITDRIAWMDSQLGFDPAAVLLGDVNGDGEVSIADVNAVMDMILMGRSESNGDVNGDGEVGIADVNAVLDIILNQ